MSQAAEQPVIAMCEGQHVYVNVSTDPGQITWECRRCHSVRP